jgi:predicted Fe-Mo cluster-binding NifX family protein
VRLEGDDLVARAKLLAELGPRLLICGAVSWPLEAMLSSAGIRVIPNIRGSVDEVIAAFIAGRLTDPAFRLPGCCGRGGRRRARHRRREPL